MLVSIKIAILQCMLALLIDVNSAEAKANTQILLDDKLRTEGFSYSLNVDEADWDDNTDFSLLGQIHLGTTKRLSALVSLFAPQKALGRFHSTPPIRAPPPLSTRNT